MSDSTYPIQMVARLTGLSVHVIRIWEQRYEAVQPKRTKGKRRMYSEREVDRLKLLRDATRTGHSIGQIARLPTPKLRELAKTSKGREVPEGTAVAHAEALIQEALSTIRTLDASAFEEVLRRANLGLGAHAVVRTVIAPLTQAIGVLWQEGKLRPVHEHFATAIIRNFLTNLTRPFGGTGAGSALVVATPAGQLHELGALLVRAAAATLGWRVTYLGASLPAAEIAAAALQQNARAVALSIVYPENDPSLAGELRELRACLPGTVAIIAGGRAAVGYQEILKSIGALLAESLDDLGEALAKA